MSISKVFFQFFFSVFYFSFVSFFAFCSYSAYNEHDGMTETTRLNWIRWEWNIVSMPMDLAYFPWSLSFYGFTLTSSECVYFDTFFCLHLWVGESIFCAPAIPLRLFCMLIFCASCINRNGNFFSLSLLPILQCLAFVPCPATDKCVVFILFTMN